MHAILPRATIAGVLVLALAAQPAATQPAWNHPVHEVPTHANLAGWDGARADSAAGHFEVMVHDIAMTPLADFQVTIEFPELSTSQMRIAAEQADPRLHVDCELRTIWTLTDASGKAHFTLIGGSRNPPGPDLGHNYFRVICDDPPASTQKVWLAAFDLDGQSGVTPLDLLKFSAALFAVPQERRADYDGDGLVTALDLSRWGAVYFEGRSWSSAASYCP